jgi:alkanesulfonate monooxygenase SsuD/methylene tetrahydromethanopterin reductase-like flavin-dependent oxidoreductase (luciferase family)
VLEKGEMMAMLGLRFDLRVPEFSATTHRAQYAACLEMCEWADRLGLDSIVLQEHHGLPDGYLPAPLALAGVVLGRTPRISVSISAVIVPLHDPVRLAEQIAVLDVAAPGRISVIAAIGYRAAEFEMAGVEKKGRGVLLEECVDVWRRAWTGEPFEWRGRQVVVTPTPATPGGPMVLIGGGSEQAARRAARLRCGFFPTHGDPALAVAYEDEAMKVGFVEGFCGLPSGPGFVMVSEDPDATWDQIGPNVLYDNQTYEAWQDPPQAFLTVAYGARTWQDVRASGIYRVVTPDECVELVHEQGDFGALLLHPLMGGIPPELAWESLELFEHKVLPRVRPA